MVNFGVSTAEKPGPLAQVEMDTFRAVQKVSDGARDGESVSFIDLVLGSNLQNWCDGQL